MYEEDGWDEQWAVETLEWEGGPCRDDPGDEAPADTDYELPDEVTVKVFPVLATAARSNLTHSVRGWKLNQVTGVTTEDSLAGP